MKKSESKGKVYHVVLHPKGWAVKTEGVKRAVQVVRTKAEAIQIARSLAKKCGRAQVKIHNRNGKTLRNGLTEKIHIHRRGETCQKVQTLMFK